MVQGIRYRFNLDLHILFQISFGCGAYIEMRGKDIYTLTLCSVMSVMHN